MTSERSLITIDSANRIALIPELSAALAFFTPLGSVAQIVAKYMACRVEIKRIEMEREANRQSFKEQQLKIDATLKTVLASIQARRDAMELFFDYANAQLKQHRIERSVLTTVMLDMSAFATSTDKNIPPEARRFATETVQTLSTQLVLSLQQDSMNFTALLEASRRDLLSLPSVKGLLPSSE